MASLERDAVDQTPLSIVVGFKHGYHCMACGKVIRIAIFKGGDYCCDNCRKALGKDIK